MDKKIATFTNTKDILNKYNIRLNKKLGQHFLIDNKIMRKIIEVSDLKGKEKVIEIGSGIGSLTQYLLEEVKLGKVLAIEKDSRFIKILEDLFDDYNNLEILKDDILQVNWDNFIENNKLENEKVKIIANLPYYITTPIIENLLFSPLKISEMVFMMQREVAKRLNASPGNKDYGSLSVFIQFHYKTEIKFEVKPESFIPRPAVHSAVIKLTPYDEIPYKVQDKNFFFDVVRAIFNLRRKNIKNSLTLSPHLKLDKDIILEGLKKSNIDKRIRGENLSIEEMVSLSNKFWELKNKKEG
ncbi:MAG: 16S rRNA (adenine(1518)-N(6)/adenine(1519)-N(6))-dimethyltransferase RsmA [Halanaerobiales bacterium]|nr:16S rRNA (adenine(1518)-N(6)/adenine(1519)-N(6))-dimethyltransferase RsmA [Halanaerobiales bacterium]